MAIKKQLNGFHDAIEEVFGGIISTAILMAFVKIIPQYSWLILVIFLIGSYFLALRLLSFGIVYLITWIIGVLIISKSLSLNLVEISLYIVVPIIGVVLGVYSNKKATFK